MKFIIPITSHELRTLNSSSKFTKSYNSQSTLIQKIEKMKLELN